MAPGPPFEEASRQFRLIGELSDSLNDAGVDFWLAGGWAVDFQLGRITRPHSDIDLIVHLADRAGLGTLLKQKGIETTGIDDTGGIEWFEANGARIEVTYIEKTKDGSLVTPGYESWPWPEGSFPEEDLTFDGITVPAMSIVGLLDVKTQWETHLGERPRPHDLSDIGALEALLDLRRKSDR